MRLNKSATETSNVLKNMAAFFKIEKSPNKITQTFSNENDHLKNTSFKK